MIYYPFSYMFRAPAMLLPHESTVAHEQRFIMDEPMISRSRLRQEPTIDDPQYQPHDELLQITQNPLSSGQVSLDIHFPFLSAKFAFFLFIFGGFSVCLVGQGIGAAYTTGDTTICNA